MSVLRACLITVCSWIVASAATWALVMVLGEGVR